tara:strand:+ start:2910 stop:3335 length:426 start_codon:yes stop_codon:yes gene_type:complete
MSKVINVTNLNTVNIMSRYDAGEFRMVVKTRQGMTVVDARDFENPRIMANPELAISTYKKGALQTVQFKPEGSIYWLTVFARAGKKINTIDEAILEHLTVGTINQLYYNTELYSQLQYNAVQSKSWACKAYVMNEWLHEMV